MVLLLLAALSAVTAAQAAGPAGMARYFPAGTQFFAAIRTDDAYLDTLDGVVGRLAAQLPADLGLPPIGLRDALTMGLAQTGLTYEGIRAWLGDYAALGVLATAPNTPTGTPVVAVAIAITDQAAAATFIELALRDTAAAEAPERSEEAGFIIYRPTGGSTGEGFIAIGQEVLLIVVGQDTLPAGGLETATAFTTALGGLPAAGYNIVIYADTAAIVATNPNAAANLAPLNLRPEDLIPLVVGFTLLDEDTLAVDAVLPTAATLAMLAPVNSAFAAVVPAEFSLVALGGRLDAALNQALDVVALASQNSDNPVTRQQLADLFRGFTTIDLDTEVLAWLTGDFALMADVDMRPVLEQAQAGNVPSGLPLAFGLVFDVRANSAAARSFVDKAGALLLREARRNPSPVTFSVGEVAGVPAVIAAGVPLEDAGTIDLVLAASETLLVLADRATAETILSGDYAGLDTTAAAQGARPYFLPDPALILYTDGAAYGDLIALAGATTLAVPANANDQNQALEALQFGYALFDSSSVTVSLVDGGLLARAVLTLSRD